MSESDHSSPERIANNTYSAFIEDLKFQDLEVRPDEEIRSLIRKTRDESLSDKERQQARNEIIEANLRAIPYVIKNLPKTGVAPEELVGEGFEVLNSCIDNFDPDHISPKTEDIVKFSSYLMVSLEAKLRNPISIEGVDQKIRLPLYVENYIGVMKKVREKFLQERHKEPNATEWYRATVEFLGKNRSLQALKGFSPEVFDATRTHRIEKRHVQIGRKTRSGKMSTDTLSTSYGNIEETISDPDIDIEKEVIKKMLEEDMEDVISTLTNRQKRVLELRHGIGFNEKGEPNPELTLQKVADIFGVTRENIRRIEQQGLRKLRHPSRSRKIRDYAESSPDIYAWDREERDYKDVINKTAKGIMKENTRKDIVAFLKELRSGSKDTGKFDRGLLSEIFSEGQVMQLLYRERTLKSSPRVLSRDLLNEVNNIIKGIKEGQAELYNTDDFGRYLNIHQKHYYWEKEKEIDPDELNGKLKQ